MSASYVEPALSQLISTYNELNSSVIEEFHEEPSPLEFMRYVSCNTPLVIRGGASSWTATQKWNYSYLTSVLKGQRVNVAVTPHGNADSPTCSPEHNTTLFAKPHEEDQDFESFLDHIRQQEKDSRFPPGAEVRYAQTQNDNFRHEYVTLLPDALKDVPFARIALQKSPDAVNLWIGNSKSVTAAHKDNFENIFVQIIGRKHFTLLPPLCQPCMNEQYLKPATYVRQAETFSLRLDEAAEAVPSALWDPDHPERNQTVFSKLARPMRVTLYPGDMMYLPAMWYHKVTQSCAQDEEGFVVAINYWLVQSWRRPVEPQ